VAFLEAGFYPANQNNLKRNQKVVVGWKKAGPSKKPLLFWSRKGNVQISYDASEERGVCSNRQSTVIWGRGIWSNRHITFIMAEKA